MTIIYKVLATRTNVEITKQLFSDLGFIVHNEKSVFIPSQEVTFLGFLLKSVTMTISLTPEKVTHFLESEDKFRKRCIYDNTRSNKVCWNVDSL